MQRVKIIAGLTYVLLKETRAFAIQSNGFSNAASASNNVAESHVQLGMMGSQCHHFAEIFFGRGGVILRKITDPEIPERGRRVRLQFDQAFPQLERRTTQQNQRKISDQLWLMFL